MTESFFPFYAKDTFDINYYKIISYTEGLKVGKLKMEMRFPEHEKLINWKKADNPTYLDLITISKEAFNEHFIKVQEDINRILIHKS